MSDRTEIFELPEGGGRLDKVLSALLEISRAEVQRLLEAGSILFEGEPLARRTRLPAGARIEVQWPEASSSELQPREMELDVLYEDADVRAVNKAAGVVVHPGDGTSDDTLVNGLLFLEPALAAIDDGKGRPGIVHRLDKDTSGVMVTARTIAAQEALQHAFAKRRARKYYLAITTDRPRHQSPLTGPIGRHPKRRQKMAVVEDGKPAVSHYRMLAASEKAHLWLVRIETGRTHQIRVHFADAGAPLLGDDVYGRRRVGALAPRQMLHAWQLSVPHPTNGTRLVLQAPMPADFIATLVACGLDPAVVNDGILEDGDSEETPAH